MPRNVHKAFTLSELLIALAILGVIATFTIPKVLQSQQDSKNKSIAKEVAATISEAYQAYKLKNSNIYMQTVDLKPYLNHVREKTSGLVDYLPTNGTQDCSDPNIECLELHNGAVLYYWGDSFCNTTDPTALPFVVDADGKGDGKVEAVGFWLYNNGKLRTRTTMETNTRWGWAGLPTCQMVLNPAVGLDPTWFGWN